MVFLGFWRSDRLGYFPNFSILHFYLMFTFLSYFYFSIFFYFSISIWVSCTLVSSLVQSCKGIEGLNGSMLKELGCR